MRNKNRTNEKNKSLPKETFKKTIDGEGHGPIFKGKWMSTGLSKNGETSMDYAYHYPNDMDLAVAFCSPFCVSLDDKCFGDYLFNEANTEEIRDLMKKHIRSALCHSRDCPRCDKF